MNRAADGAKNPGLLRRAQKVQPGTAFLCAAVKTFTVVHEYPQTQSFISRFLALTAHVGCLDEGDIWP